ncbi:MAG: hypothetical protein M3314_05870 [Actinomycetota bacterium]|nr:hypothetical protein [Actinomycetota bacterium]
MANATSTSTGTVSDSGCGCCRPEPKTRNDIIRELESRLDALDTRLARVSAR